MYLLLCGECADVVKLLVGRKRSCACGKHSGYIDAAGRNVYVTKSDVIRVFNCSSNIMLMAFDDYVKQVTGTFENAALDANVHFTL